jgi:hypothetical protein
MITSLENDVKFMNSNIQTSTFYAAFQSYDEKYKIPFVTFLL